MNCSLVVNYKGRGWFCQAFFRVKMREMYKNMREKIKFRRYNYFHHIGKGVERFLRSLCRFFYFQKVLAKLEGGYL